MNMSFKFPHQIAAISAALAVSLYLAACATTGSAVMQKLTLEQMQKRAAERSTARWKALTDKRFGEAYGYLSEASRVGTTAAEYDAAMQRMGYLASNLVQASCDDIVCTVKTNVTLPVYIRNIGARPQIVPVEELWTLQNGELWLIRR